ncbi:divalent metal cation transporter [Mobilicoccus sp.]|uniref:NRAMP family divalent metal transporter n=1 Tax=Mobilicoccus sp. TaxID=2034349 RepID=UPI002897CC94|nr:divalent metal cation transporter [Mobilicoccus sp.]
MATSASPAEGAEARAALRARRSALLGAMFLMATSAIGPGFITQTTTFTAKLGAAFAFAIIVSIVVDIAVQMNVWRVVGVSGLRAHELANSVVPGAGWLLTILVVVGGLVFNIGNVAGTGLGLDAMIGLDPRWGGALSALVAIGIFLSHRAGAALDRIVVVLGLVMIVLTAFVAVTSHPPVGEALRNVVMPSNTGPAMLGAITTLVGGTVGGYITYAGAHRLLDSGTTGPENVGQISRSSITGIVITGIMRILLFLAILGVTTAGVALDPANPAASAFEHAAGVLGLRVFGVILWAAAITSVIGASYTSVSFLTTRSTSQRTRTILTVAFIAVCTLAFVLLGQAPVTLLVFAGLFNGIILPLGFTLILLAIWRRRDLFGGAYRHPMWLTLAGVLAWLLTLWLGYVAVSEFWVKVSP